MRKVIAGLFITLDGVAEAPDQWQEHFDDEMGASLQAHIDRTDAILMGRVTYQEWTDYWPTGDYEPFASYINNAPKYVASTTLKDVSWGQFSNISLLKGSLADEIARLKALPGKDISVAGSPGLLRALFQAGLLDELTLLIHPVVAGKGKHLFKDGDDLKRLKLVENKSTRTGTIIVTYIPA